MNRRDFMRLLGLSVAAAFVAPLAPSPIISAKEDKKEPYNHGLFCLPYSIKPVYIQYLPIIKA